MPATHAIANCWMRFILPTSSHRRTVYGEPARKTSWSDEHTGLGRLLTKKNDSSDERQAPFSTYRGSFRDVGLASLESFREPRNTVGIVQRGRLFPAARHRRATPSSARNDWLQRAAFRAPLSRNAHISRSAFIRWPLDSYMSCDELLQLQPAPDDDLESLSEAGSETHAWSSEYRPDLFIPVARSNFWRFVSAKPRFQNP